MKKIVFYFFCLVLFTSCGEKTSGKAEENLTSGTATMYVDNSVLPVVEDVAAVFQSRYPQVNLKTIGFPETDIIRFMLADSARIVVLTRKLTADEESNFRKRKITAKINEFASDAVALVAQKNGDTVIDLQEILKVFQGKPSKVSRIVFDSPDSGTVKFLMEKAGVKTLPKQNIYALKNNAQVLEYVKNNKGAIGAIGLNLLLQPTKDVENLVREIEVLSVSDVKNKKIDNKAYKPNQSTIAAGSYPLIRKLYVLNYQGIQGLGMGFANYVTSPDGQRIILKSGLLPVTMPTREIEVTNNL
ncbi:substrate-binding domain-containing protein [Flavobacterium sp. J372]|uniref:PstS family phosphate ABC transporter substrate-binding protein n=1 Tax=Flavobacterium sp. J372 TaxID=2898436 RepID=UPI0021515327|nr:substrate-binding domain-containing protein [Flavobacterium sp. J372]MCR5861499.1 substrate-binding domain-containing protein [Flavobacterium sp. J372]